LRQSIAPFVTGKKVLELGCGEGHLTGVLFWDAASVRGIDISGIAISRAVSKGISSASFENSDFLNISFARCDVAGLPDFSSSQPGYLSVEINSLT
jgi:trans-aconitate methyltransferase